MARKNLLAGVTGTAMPRADNEARSEYTRRGASRSMMMSIDEMAENSKRLVAGEAIVDLDANLLDSSFVSDRVEDDDEDYLALREAIRARGQSTPILVRPHPQAEGRYMIVFGHRRARVARDLGIPVRAVVRQIEDIAHIVAQGQENTARADLTFIEKSLFSKKLLEMGQTKETIKSALTIDDTLLSRMLAVVEVVPLPIIEAIGAAKGVGRDRWEELKKLVTHPKNAELSLQIVRSSEFGAIEGGTRFSYLLTQLKSGSKGRRKASATNIQSASWAPADNTVAASYRNTGKTFNLSLKSKNAGEFGRHISTNLDALYQEFMESRERSETGD